MNDYNKVIYPDVENNYPKKLIQYLVNRFVKDEFTCPQILDVGCGKGTHMKLFKDEFKHAKTYGVDIRDNGDNIKRCNIEKDMMPFRTDTFDIVYSKSLIEHINSPDNFFREINRVLKPGGICIIMTPDWKSQQSHFWDDYTHVHPYTRKSLMNAMKIFGYTHSGCEYFYQLPFVWKYSFLKFIPKILSLCPQSWKWKDQTETNGKDRKLIRFSKEKMLLAWGTK